MGLSEDVESPTSARCGYAATLDSLPEEEAAAARAGVADDGWGVMALSRIFAKHKLPITHQQISRHRRDECVQCR